MTQTGKKSQRQEKFLLQHISEPLTIKELSRKVAINECYLKNGCAEHFFKAFF